MSTAAHLCLLSAQKLKLGEVWTQLLESQQRASAGALNIRAAWLRCFCAIACRVGSSAAYARAMVGYRWIARCQIRVRWLEWWRFSGHTRGYPVPPPCSAALTAQCGHGSGSARFPIRSGGVAAAGGCHRRWRAAQPQPPGKWCRLLHRGHLAWHMPLCRFLHSCLRGFWLLTVWRGVHAHPHLPALPGMPQQSSGLRDRLAALSRRYSSTTLEQAEAAAASEAAAAEGPAGAEKAGPADVVEAEEDAAEASLMAAAAAAVSPGLAATPARSPGSTQIGGETPTRLGSVGSTLARSPGAFSPAEALPELPVGGIVAGRPADVVDRMDAILADVQQRLSSLEAAAAANTAAAGAAAAAAAEAPPGAAGLRQAAWHADAATQTAAVEQAAMPALDVCFRAVPAPAALEGDASSELPASSAAGRAATGSWRTALQARLKGVGGHHAWPEWSWRG